MVFSRLAAFFTCAMMVASCSYTPNSPAPTAQQESWQHRQQGAMSGAAPYSYGQAGAYANDEPMTSGPVEVVKVALLLPLTGRDAKVGKALQDAAVLALFDKYAAMPPESIRVRVELIPKDTKADPARAALATQEAIKEGAKLIIGPLFSQSVSAAAPIARAANVNMVSFSNNRAVAGDNVFLLGFQPDEQVGRVTRYMAATGIETVAVLSPSTPYGQTITESLKSYARELNIKLEPIVYYNGMAGPTPEEVATIANSTANGRFAFDALFAPEGSDLLKTMLPLLEARGINRATTQLVGTGLWDEPAVRRSNDLTGAWYASAPNAGYKSFVDRFISTYDYDPPRIASLGYDAVALATTLASMPNGFDKRTIADPSGYAGPANGVFRFHRDGTAERGLAVLEVVGPDVKEIDAAPRSFLE